jgi:medium-chain acyl-[acyl-carrier-protein] hydrolase
MQVTKGGNVTNPWLVRFETLPTAAMRLFCFPYAGGSAHAFADWTESLPGQIEVLGVQLPGRGARMFQPAYTSLTSLVRDLSGPLLPLLDKPYAFFGHSMGTVIAFELARCFRARGVPRPIHLFLSGSVNPRYRERTKFRSTFTDEQLTEELKSFNGAVTAVFNDSELMRIMLPTIRADFKLCETYVYQPSQPLETPITAFGGLDDPEVPQERLQFWQEETKARFSLHLFPGGHFYLHSARAALLEVLEKELALYLQPARVS